MPSAKRTSASHRARRDRLVGAGALAIGLAIAVPLWMAAHHSAVTGQSRAAASVVSATDAKAQVPTGLTVLHSSLSLTYRPPQHAPAFPAIEAVSGILIDTDTGTVLWERNEHQALPPASTTKIMTALVALQNFRDDHRVTITPSALTQQWDETKMGLTAGQTLTVRELLFGMMMVSANDAADSLATDTVGMSAYVQTMNAQLAALGLHDSHFVQPVGLDDPGQKVSAYDLAVLGITAYDNFALFRTIVGTEQTVLPATDTHSVYYLNNINLLLTMYPGVLGIKPGFTGNAGYCLVAMSTRGGHRLVSVLMNAPLVYKQSSALLDWGFRSLGVPSALPSPTPTPATAHVP
jgi:serine-type D-Ala-D-Ala carboxypeptidase (penicillin-binding protein 5/6)